MIGPDWNRNSIPSAGPMVATAMSASASVPDQDTDHSTVSSAASNIAGGTAVQLTVATPRAMTSSAAVPGPPAANA